MFLRRSFNFEKKSSERRRPVEGYVSGVEKMYWIGLFRGYFRAIGEKTKKSRHESNGVSVMIAN